MLIWSGVLLKNLHVRELNVIRENVKNQQKYGALPCLYTNKQLKCIR